MAETSVSRFSTRQTATGFLFFAVLAVVLCVFLLARDFDSPVTKGLIFAVLVLISSALLFYSLIVEVTDRELRLRFGIGVIKKRFQLADIQAVNPVRNHWYYGWGIRRTPHGWLYNAEGLDAVELRLGTGRRVRVGTNDPAGLTLAIQSAVRRDK